MNAQQNDPWVTVGYEVEMFRRLLPHLKSSDESRPEWEIRNAITESALLHARQLADILLSRTKATTDIKLEGLMPNFQPTRLHELEQVYGDTRGGICHTLNKYAMHPTTLRTHLRDYMPELERLAPIIEDIVSEIERHRGSMAFEWTGGGKSTVAVEQSTRASTHVPTSHVLRT